MDNLEIIYMNLDNLNRRIYNKESNHTPIELGDNMKILEYDITYAEAAITVSEVSSTAISQFERVLIKVNLIGASPVAKKAIRLFISDPDFTDGAESVPNDFQHSYFMIPSPDEPESYYLSLSSILNTGMTVGELNEMPIMFQMVDQYARYNSNILDIELYSSNLTEDWSTNDLINIFNKISNLEDRLSAIEGE